MSKIKLWNTIIELRKENTKLKEELAYVRFELESSAQSGIGQARSSLPAIQAVKPPHQRKKAAFLAISAGLEKSLRK